eukprot:TRINITY_DN4295_c0_g1_i1.p1 TRINITY_DN4295_c0_g1~~TRINITY_DN4295_c0_g1_i1.p1  ORF type:complete len:463 (-),score=143.67 TRINITY_DN4295_c0_g1_i1:57-1445(-)
MRRHSQQMQASRDGRSVAVRIFVIAVAVGWLFILATLVRSPETEQLTPEEVVAAAAAAAGEVPVRREILKGLPFNVAPDLTKRMSDPAGPRSWPKPRPEQQRSAPQPDPPAPAAAAVAEDPAAEDDDPEPDHDAAEAAARAAADARHEEPVATKEPVPWLTQERFSPDRVVDSVLWVQKYSDVPEGECQKADGHSKLLSKVNIWGGSARKTPRVFCGIYTHHKNHDTKVKAIKETWASRCDGFVPFSDQDDTTIPTLGIKHIGEESWDNMWQKTRAIWQYIHHHYRNDYDWFLMGGDDMFIVVENLRKYLVQSEKAFKNEAKPFYLGMRFRLPSNDIFHSGGASYVLNVAALDALVSAMQLPSCGPDLRTFAEDVQVAKCLKAVGVLPLDTKDALGEERFHPFTPGHHLQYRIPAKKDWYAEYAIGLKEGMACCSADSISFHYMTPELMRRVFHLLYTCKLS